MSNLVDQTVLKAAPKDLPLSIVFNIASGSGDAERSRQEMQQILQEAKREHEFFLVRNPKQLHQLARNATDNAIRNSGAVVVAGGDGTINAVAQATLRSGRPFGIVPQGTFNYSGRAHAIPLDTAAATRTLLKARLEPMQVGLVNDRVFLVNASLGLYPQLLQDRETYKAKLGRYRGVAMLAALATVMRGSGRLTLELEHDGKKELVKTPSLFIGNNALQLEQAGLPEADAIKERHLAGIIVRDHGLTGLMSLVLHGAMGKLAEVDEVRTFPFQKLTVSPAIRGVRKLKVALDGEIHWMKTPLVFSVAQQSLQLLVPDGEAKADHSREDDVA